MSSATNVKAMFLSPLMIYSMALLVMAANGWWTDNLEIVFAAPVTAMLFTLLDYPLAVALLWIVYRRWPSRSVQFGLAVGVALALAGYFALIAPFNFFRFSTVFMATLVCVTGLAWGTVYALARQPRH